MTRAGSHRLQIDYFVTFCAVIQESGFSAAARRLHMSQPAVSHQVSALEQELGCRLIDRTKRPPELTPVGREVYPHLAGCVEAFRGAEMITRRNQRGEGEFRLSAVYTVGERLLPQVLPSFRDAHQGVAITVTVSDRLQVMHSVLDGAAHLGISFLIAGDPEAPAALKVLPVRDEPLHLVVARSHPWAGVSILEPEALSAGEFILRDPRLATRGLVEEALDASRLNVVMEVGTNEALRAAVKAGLGAGFMYASALDEDLAAVAVRGFSAHRHLVALTPRDWGPTPLVRALLDLL